MEQAAEMHRGWCCGTFTVEAVFVVPILLGLIFAYTFQLFYMHDCIVLQDMLHCQMIEVIEGTLHGANAEDSDALEETGGVESGTGAQDVLEQESVDLNTIQRDSRVWIMQVKRYRIRKGSLRVKGNVQAEVTWKIPVMQSFLQNHFRYQMDETMEKLSPVQSLRYRREEQKETGEEGERGSVAGVKKQ